jgi:ERCC4-related helicase
MFKDFKPRIYQQTILSTAVTKNTLVVLPTGLGKTFVALLLAMNRLENYPNSKVLILAPTRPLVEQHLETFLKHTTLDKEKIILFTGFVKPEKRLELWKEAKVIISTPQAVENDIISNSHLLNDISLLVVDEAHRAVKNYAYVFIAKRYMAKANHSRILALTASPGSNTEKIEEVCQNLSIEGIEVRSDDDPDVKPYVQETDVKWITVPFPEEFKVIKHFLEDCYNSKLAEIRNFGYLYGSASNYTRTTLLALQASLHSKIASGEKDYSILKSISLLAEAMKVQHGLELLETQGLTSLSKYLEKIVEQSKTTSVKAVKNLVNDLNFKSAIVQTNNLLDENVEHPKLKALNNLLEKEVSENKDVKIIIFVQYRTSIIKINQLIEGLGIKSNIFMGQAKKENTGISQKEQKEILDRFRNGDFNCLISTSVGEEGLDIPQVDLVIFYEPTSSAVRHIQRRGRTGRQEKGRVVVLVTEKTRDEASRWSAFHKEKKMHRVLNTLKNKFSGFIKPDKKLTSFIQNPKIELKIVADHREKASGIIKHLIDEGVKIQLQKLDIGDYLLSEDVVVEYKTKADFVNSIIDGRLLSQIRELKKYSKPLLIIEGEEDIYSQRNIHPNAIRGMLSTIALDYRIPIIFTKNFQDTAGLFLTILKREQDPEKKDFQMHTFKPTTLKEQQEFIISSLPGVGSTLAKPLLKKFKSVKKVINASEDNLKKINLIGDKKAQKIREVLDSEYEDS